MKKDNATLPKRESRNDSKLKTIRVNIICNNNNESKNCTNEKYNLDNVLLRSVNNDLNENLMFKIQTKKSKLIFNEKMKMNKTNIQRYSQYKDNSVHFGVVVEKQFNLMNQQYKDIEKKADKMIKIGEKIEQDHCRFTRPKIIYFSRDFNNYKKNLSNIYQRLIKYQ